MKIYKSVRKKSTWGNRKVLTAVFWGILLLAAAWLGGCGDSRDMFVRIPEETLQAGQENSQAVIPEGVEEPGTTEPSETEPSEAKTPESENLPQRDTTVPAASVPQETITPEGEKPEQLQTGNAESGKASGTQELNGSIQSVGSYGFTVYQIHTEQQEDGGMIAYSSKEQNTLVDVSFTERTVFTITSSSDGGLTSSSAPGTKADLEVSRTTYMTGKWEGNIFLADTVTIYHFD